MSNQHITPRTTPRVLEPSDFSLTEAIDPRWIDRVLEYAGLRVAPVTSIQAVPVGLGTTSTVLRLTVNYANDSDAAPRTLIAKFPKTLANGKAPNAAVFGYDREVLAYQFFGQTPPCRMPKCYFADIRADGVFNLVLEDLGDGCWPGNQITGCSIEEAGAVVHTLATLHRAYYGSTELAGLGWPRRRKDLAEQSAQRYAQGAIVMRERYSEALGAAALTIIDRAAPLVGAWSATTSTVETLIHTDPRVDNIIFEKTAQGIQACLIDLQSMAVGDPAYDIAYFLTGSLEPAERAACERALVESHAATLAQSDIAVNTAAAWESYRQHAIAGLVATVSAAALLPASPAIDGLLIALARRNCAAVVALDGIAAAQRRIDNKPLQSD